MSNYTLTQAEYKRLKTRLTFRQNRLKKAIGDRRSIDQMLTNGEAIKAEALELVKEAKYALAIFEEKGSPDSWNNWERAKEDADQLFRRMGGRVQ